MTARTWIIDRTSSETNRKQEDEFSRFMMARFLFSFYFTYVVVKLMVNSALIDATVVVHCFWGVKGKNWGDILYTRLVYCEVVMCIISWQNWFSFFLGGHLGGEICSDKICKHHIDHLHLYKIIIPVLVIWSLKFLWYAFWFFSNRYSFFVATYLFEEGVKSFHKFTLVILQKCHET